MTGYEKFEHALSLEPCTSKEQIPIYPHYCTYVAKAANMTQAQIFEGNDSWMKAYEICNETLGYPDIAFPIGPKMVCYIEQMKVLVPGKDLPDDELFQFKEEQIMSVDDYDLIVNKGFGAWQMPMVASIQNPPFTGPFKKFKAIKGFIDCGSDIKKNKKYWDAKGMPMMFHSGCAPAFDMFSLSRSLEEFFYDLYDEPDKVKAAIKKATPAIIKTGINAVKSSKGNRIAIFAMRSSATFISTDMFEEFAWPSLKQMIEEFYAAGIKSVIHCDGNWLPMMKYFNECPRGSCIIELDGATDFEEAYKIVKGHQILRGDVPASVLAFGTEEETQAYCDKLIDLAMQGGIIIGTGCEVPLNAKPENMKILLNCTKGNK